MDLGLLKKRVEPKIMIYFFRLYAKGYKGYNIQEILFNYRIDIENEKHKKYRPMKDRINEAKVRYGGFKALHLGYRSIPYVIKPIIIGLIPAPIFLRDKEKNNIDNEQ